MGIVIAVVAVILVSRVADETGSRAGLLEALIGGTAIGLFGVAIAAARARATCSPTWPSIGWSRASSSSIAVLAIRSAWRPGRRCSRSSLIGVLDTAGNGFYLVAVQTGQLAIASVLSAMYPVVTVVLAAVVLREPVTRDHTVGIVLAGAAIALIGSGRLVAWRPALGSPSRPAQTLDGELRDFDRRAQDDDRSNPSAQDGPPSTVSRTAARWRSMTPASTTRGRPVFCSRTSSAWRSRTTAIAGMSLERPPREQRPTVGAAGFVASTTVSRALGQPPGHGPMEDPEGRPPTRAGRPRRRR